MGGVRIVTTLILALAILPAAVTPATAGCVASLVQAADRHGVPPDLMLALGHAESGWKAYAVNSAGVSHFPDTAAEAVELVRSEQARGIRSIDVGCGQINLRWHPDVFDDLADAFDPERNAEYAASFLARLKAAHGDWRSAVARYHSSEPGPQQAYLDRVFQRLVILQDGAPPDYFTPRAVADAEASTPLDDVTAAADPAQRVVHPRIVDVSPNRSGDAGGRVIRLPDLSQSP